tara:strand:+ start:278 stop:484 length:207 start_codon:yes stop_codon:yes gene_type:complete
MDKLFLFVGLNTSGSTIIMSWAKKPTQEQVDRVVSEKNKQYSEFALMEDILFIPGNAEEASENKFDYY